MADDLIEWFPPNESVLSEYTIHNLTTLNETQEIPDMTISDVLESNVTPIEAEKAPKDISSYVCSICKCEFLLQSEIDRHMLWHRKERSHEYFEVVFVNDKEAFKCKMCKNHFSTKEDFVKHELHGQLIECEEQPPIDQINGKISFNFLESQKVLDDTVSEVLEKKVITVEIRKDPKDNMYVCPICDIRRQIKMQINQHMHRHRRESPNEYLNVVFMSDDKTLKCKKCPKSFSTKDDLERHMRMHGPFICALCYESFPSECKFKSHFLGKHMKKEPFQCIRCTERFNNREELLQHIHTHNFVKCEKCDKNFLSVKRMKGHYYRFHPNEKSWQCGLCPKSFAFKSSFEKHCAYHVKQREVLEKRVVSKYKECKKRNEQSKVLKIVTFEV